MGCYSALKLKTHAETNDLVLSASDEDDADVKLCIESVKTLQGSAANPIVILSDVSCEGKTILASNFLIASAGSKRSLVAHIEDLQAAAAMQTDADLALQADIAILKPLVAAQADTVRALQSTIEDVKALATVQADTDRIRQANAMELELEFRVRAAAQADVKQALVAEITSLRALVATQADTQLALHDEVHSLKSLVASRTESERLLRSDMEALKGVVAALDAQLQAFFKDAAQTCIYVDTFRHVIAFADDGRFA